ncbi:hypothetical protein C4578_01625 [Candidatus Microgenomates bacterium]|jgi:hypothetical protein|nr:MAG: hypothetical protein C4578_01625 [Candidatus Microgenomates bacterium]
MRLPKSVEISLIICLLLIGIVVSSAKILLQSADIGRHLKNGEIIIKTRKIPQTNLYSYTYPEFPFTNHHWGSGVIFYLVHSFSGFTGLSVFFIFLNISTFYLFFKIAKRESDFTSALLVSLLFIPVSLSRVEVRPEVFSYLFSGLIFWILLTYKLNNLKIKWLFLIPLIELLWINLHIYFFLGFFILSIFWLEAVIGSFINKTRKIDNSSNNKTIKDIVIIGLISLAAVLVNPAGIKGMLYPLNIFDNYSYPVSENVSVFVHDMFGYGKMTLSFKMVFAASFFSWIIPMYKRKSVEIRNIIFYIFFSVLAWSATRNFAIFGLFATVTTAKNIKLLTGQEQIIKDKITALFLVYSLFFLIVLVNFCANPAYWLSFFKYRAGIGLCNGVSAAEFIKKEEISGPIFNNYDIGGYLIYHLYPYEKVFVDNRPEAYPSDFFKKIYIPMQENEKVWQEVDDHLGFNVIVFNKLDGTDWARAFLSNRLNDSRWALVWTDEFTIIFVKRNENNKEVIEKYEYPKDALIRRY